MVERPATDTPVPDPTELTSEAIDRRVSNAERVIDARIDGMDTAIAVFQENLTRVPTQTDRAINALRDLIEARLIALESNSLEARRSLAIQTEANMSVLATRLAGMDKAIELLQTSANKIPDFVRDQVNQIRDLHAERFTSIATELNERDKRTEQKFSGIDTQFSERDKRTEQLSLADKTAIAAALQAQKEAAGATNESNSVALAKMEANFTKLIEQGQTLVNSVRDNLMANISDIKGRLDRGEGKASVADPDTTAKLNSLMAQMSSLGTSRDQHFGSEKTAADSSTRIMAIIAVAVAALVGFGEILAKVH